MDTIITIIVTIIIIIFVGMCLKILNGGRVSSNEEMSYDGISEDEDDDRLTYDWGTSETLQMAKAYRISSDEESSDDSTSDDFLVPEPSISGIMEGTSYISSSKRTTTVDENYIMDDMSSLSDISDIRISNAPQRHEFAKERVEREGNIYDKLSNACLKGQLSVIKDILETYNTILAPDELGQTPMYAACIGNHTDVIKLLMDIGYDVNHQDNEGKTPLHRTFENHEHDLAQTLITQFSASTEVRDAQNWTPLHTAIDQGYFKYSHDLNLKFFHQDLDSEVKWIQLHAACFEGRTQNVKVLLDVNTDVNHVSSGGYTPLHIAVIKNDTDLATLLMDQNADVNSVTSRRQTPLHIAAENCNDTIIHKLLTMKADPNLKDELGNTSLHLSVQLKHETKPTLLKPRTCTDVGDGISYQACNIQTVEEIIHHGADVNAMNHRCQTALWFACCNGQDKLVKTLLHAGANSNITNKDRDSSLHSAIYGCCNNETLQEMIDYGAHINAANENGATALLLACSRAQEDLVKLLLRAGADPNIPDADGDISLHSAIAADCNTKTLQELIDNGAEVNAQNNRDRTPLLLSCFYRYTDSVNVLLEAGADPSIGDHENFSCLHAAVDGRCSKNTLQALMDHGAYIDAKRKDGTTALLSACRTGQSESVTFLLEAGADVNIVKSDGNTCLYLAVQGHCSKETLVKIIEKGVYVDTLNNNGETALIRACYTAQRQSVNLLLEKGADPNISDYYGYSSIRAAVHGYCTNETLQEIITHKADLDSRENAGKTALLLACEYRQQDSARLLLEAGSSPNIADDGGCQSLGAAVMGHCGKKIMKTLIKHGANVNATNKQNCTALMVACDKRHIDAIDVLLKAGADTNIAKDHHVTCLHSVVIGNLSKESFQAAMDRFTGAFAKVNINGISVAAFLSFLLSFFNSYIDILSADGITLFHAAFLSFLLSFIKSYIVDIFRADGITLFNASIGRDYKKILQVLIDHDADVNASIMFNITALMLSCCFGDSDAINVLLEAGADPNITNINGDTCLHAAVNASCSKEVFQALLDHGANVKARNIQNHTALKLACKKRNLDVMKLLTHAQNNPTGANTCVDTMDLD